MIRHIPRWILVGTVLLAAVAGFINTVGLLGIDQRPLSYMTGNLTLVGVGVSSGDGNAAYLAGMLVLLFLAGATLCGFIVQQSTLKVGRRYGAVLSIESALLFTAALLLDRGTASGAWAAAMACGLQNAMVTTYSGAIIRTTHMTGVTTDLGIAMGHWLRGEQVEARRFLLLGCLLGGFVLGAVLGTLGYRHWGCLALLLPAGTTGVMGVAYFIYAQRHRQMM